MFGTKYFNKKLLPYSQECPKNIPENDYKYDSTTRTKKNASRDLPLIVLICVFGTKYFIKKFLPYSQECPKNIPKNDYKYDSTARTK